MNLLRSKQACFARQLSQQRPFDRCLHSTGALLKEADTKTQPQQQQHTTEKTPTAAASEQGKTEQQEPAEKIEYIGNTRFPRPRPKPRKTIQPGEAVGQQAPAGKVVHKALKEKIDDKWRDILSPEKNLETRARIIKEITESHWQNILDLRNNGEKLFEAPADLIPAATARYLPNLEGKTLAGQSVDIVDLCRDKTTLLTFEFVKFAEKHTRSFINVFEKTFEGNEKTQVVQVNIEENWAKAAVLKLCLPYVRRSIPKARHERYVVHYGGVESLRGTLGIANPLIGYAFLVDSKTRIRWYANGEAVKSEAATMAVLTEALLRKHKA
ncbi:Mitochondrial ATPase complex subunit atp10 [Coemansia sp. IMI 203386]|nr:Mitochondrial ATPase complex subunit atp10 [Coemansia sp. IMI 203386]